MTPKTSSVTIVPWLRANLGKSCLAGNTGTDQKALLAAVQIIELYSYDRDNTLLDAFARVVRRMQRKQWFLAFHSIAHVMDWSDRVKIWTAAGLPDFNKFDFLPRCEFEPKHNL